MSDALAHTWDPLPTIGLLFPVSQSHYKGICPVLVHLVMLCSVGILGGQLSFKKKWKSNNFMGEGKWGYWEEKRGRRFRLGCIL